MRTFVTGSTGFVGKATIEKLASDPANELLVLSRFPQDNRYVNVNALEGDLSNPQSFSKELGKFQPDATIHLAWEGIPDYGQKMSFNNLEYGLDLFSVLDEIGCKKIICSGSCWEYGKTWGEISEEDPALPTNSFTAAKTSLQLMGNDMFKESDTAFIWTRLFYVYGNGQKNNSLIPHIINTLDAGKELLLRTPYAKNDFVNVSDVANAYSSILSHCDKSEVYNIGFGRPTSISTIANLASREICGRELYDERVSEGKGEETNFWANISKIKRDTGWEPAIDIESGVKDYIKSHINL